MSAIGGADQPDTSLPPSSAVRVKDAYNKLEWFEELEKQLGAPPTAQDVSALVTIVQGLSPSPNWMDPKILPHLEEDTIQEWINTLVTTKESIYLWEYNSAKEFLGAIRRFNLDIRPQTTMVDIILAKRRLIFEKIGMPGSLFKKIDSSKGLVVFWLQPNTVDVLRKAVAGMEKKAGGQLELLDGARVGSAFETRRVMNYLAAIVAAENDMRAEADLETFRAVEGQQSSKLNIRDSSALNVSQLNVDKELNTVYPLVNPHLILHKALLGNSAEKLRNELPDAVVMRDLCNTFALIDDAIKVMEDQQATQDPDPNFDKENIRFSALLDQITNPKGLSGVLSKRQREALASLPCRFNP